MTISRNISVMAQGASTAGILAGGYGGLGTSIAPTTAGNTIFTTDGSTWSSTQKIVRGTSVATTSGTAVDFTSIPSWVKRITLMFTGVSLSGTALPLIQIGAGSITNTGYVGSGANSSAGATAFFNTVNYTTGFGIGQGSSASVAISGAVYLFNQTGNSWIASGTLASTNEAVVRFTAGSITLSGTLDRVRITTSNGTDTFDAGSVNIMYE